MEFNFTEEQNLLINTTKAFVKTELLQHEELLEKTNNLPKELYDEIKKKSIEAGLYACNMPVEHGGGGLNAFDIDLGQSSDVSYLDLDLVVDGDSNDFTFDIDSTNYTSYIDIFGDNNTMTLTKSGYGSGTGSSGYFYLDLNGSTNTVDITQSSTLALDYLKIESDASNSNICVVQNDGGTTTSC